MNYIVQIVKEQLLHLGLIFRLALYEVKSEYKNHYLGLFWQILNPFLQIGMYWFVFGLGIRGGAPVGETPYFIWLIAGLVPWLFISPTITKGSASVYSKIQVVSKMKFPISILPSIRMVINSFSFVAMFMMLLGILWMNDIFAGVYLWQLPYYFLCLYVLVYSLTLLLSSLTTMVRDIQPFIQSVIRMMMFMLPILWNVEQLPSLVVKLLQLNPFFYLIVGFRNSLLGGGWFYENIGYTIYFWSFTLLVLLIGSRIHLEFRHRFVEYI